MQAPDAHICLRGTQLPFVQTSAPVGELLPCGA
jgi:hypothetical protein